jgi:hypothetical protein
MKVIDTEQPDLLFIQEPCEYQSRLVGIDKKYRIFTAGDGEYRAAIIITNNKIDAIFITNFSDEDSLLGNNTWKPEFFCSQNVLPVRRPN